MEQFIRAKLCEVIHRLCSLSSQHAVDVGVRLARERGARVAFVHSSPDISAILFERNPYTLNTAEEVASVDPTLRTSLERAQEAGVDADLIMLGEHGADSVAAAIVGRAQGLGAMMIVVGARGRGAITEAMVGSVSRMVMEMSEAGHRRPLVRKRLNRAIGPMSLTPPLGSSTRNTFCIRPPSRGRR